MASNLETCFGELSSCKGAFFAVAVCLSRRSFRLSTIFSFLPFQYEQSSGINPQHGCSSSSCHSTPSSPAKPASASGFSSAQQATLQGLTALSVQAAVKAVAPAAIGPAESASRPSCTAASATVSSPRVHMKELSPTGTGVSSRSTRVPTSFLTPVTVSSVVVVPSFPSGVASSSTGVNNPNQVPYPLPVR